MVELPEGTGEIQIADRDDLAHWQSMGWKPLGLITETELVASTSEAPCPGGQSTESQCQHGMYGGSMCGSLIVTTHQVPVQKARVVLIRHEDETMQELRQTISELEETARATSHELYTKTSKLEEKYKQLEDINEQCARANKSEAAAKEKQHALNDTVRKQKRREDEILDENKKLRAEIHTTAMAHVLGARELVRTGGWIHPLAFIFMCDSMDHLSAKPQDYINLVEGMTHRAILEVKIDEQGCRMVRVCDDVEFFNSFRELDALRRLAGTDSLAEEEQEPVF